MVAANYRIYRGNDLRSLVVGRDVDIARPLKVSKWSACLKIEACVLLDRRHDLDFGFKFKLQAVKSLLLVEAGWSWLKLRQRWPTIRHAGEHHR